MVQANYRFYPEEKQQENQSTLRRYPDASMTDKNQSKRKVVCECSQFKGKDGGKNAVSCGDLKTDGPWGGRKKPMDKRLRRRSEPPGRRRAVFLGGGGG